VKLQPTEAEFERLAARGGLVPVSAELLADTLTPVVAFALLSAGEERAFLLESVERGEKLGRYSFLGAGPFLTFRSDLSEVTIIEEAGKEKKEKVTNPLVELEKLSARFRPAADFKELARLIPGLPRFSGGAVGYASYDAVRLVENLPHAPERSLGLPDLYFGFYDRLVIFDHVRNTVRIIVHVDPEKYGSPNAAYRAGRERIEATAARLAEQTTDPAVSFGAAGTVDPGDAGAAVSLPVDSNFTQPEYEAVVERCQ